MTDDIAKKLVYERPMIWFMIALGLVCIATALITRYEMLHGIVIGSSCIVLGAIFFALGHIIPGFSL